MRRISNIIWLLLIINFLPSCVAKIKVKVKTADREEVMQAYENLLSKTLEKSISEGKKQAEYLSFAISEYSSLKEKSPNLFQGVEMSASAEIINDYQKLDDSLNTWLNYAEGFYNNQKYLDSYGYLIKSNNALTKFYNDEDVQKSFAVVKENFDETILRPQQHNIGLIKNENKERLRYHLLGDQLTSFVTKNSNKHIWKSNYNTTRVSTLFGNTDVAILLRKNPDKTTYKSGDYNNNFTIKGVRLDAEDVIESSFKALSQSVNLFAGIQLSGTNLSSNNAESAFPALSNDINSLLNSVSDNQISFEKKNKVLSKIKEMLMERIILEDLQNKSGDELRRSLVDIKEYWDQLKSELSKLP